MLLAGFARLLGLLFGLRHAAVLFAPYPTAPRLITLVDFPHLQTRRWPAYPHDPTLGW